MPTCGYHCSAKIVSRKAGQSAIAKAAYNARENLRDEQTGETKLHSHREGLAFSGIFAPKDAPEWATDRQQLWNKVEQIENRKNSQLARELQVAIPHELNQQQREWLVKDFAREQFARKGMIADVNIHAPHPDRDERNWHAHILLPLRKLDGEEFTKHKAAHERTSWGDWRKAETAQLEQWREKWAEMGARALERAGHQIEADRWREGHKLLPAQREAALQRGDTEFAAALDREATKHRGPQVDAMQRKGIETERGNIYRDTLQQTAELRTLKAELREVDSQLGEIARGMGKLLQIGATALLKPLELVASFFDTPREITPGEIAQQKENAEAQKIDLARFRTDDEYRRQIMAAEQVKIDAERQTRYREQQQERERDR